jgi:hypothetical protein
MGRVLLRSGVSETQARKGKVRDGVVVRPAILSSLGEAPTG